jgi:alpha-aminoadipate carrier protein LysW
VHVVAIIRTLVLIAPAGAGFWHVNNRIAKPRVGTGTPRIRMATCPECDAEIEIDEFDVDKGDQLSCPECGSNLEVTGLSPVELDLAPEDDDEDDEDLEDDDQDDLDDEDEEEDTEDWDE